MNKRLSGFTIIQLIIVLAVASLVTASLANIYVIKARKARAAYVNDYALTVIRAMDGYYTLRCNLPIFPQPSISTLRDLGLIAGQDFLNPFGDSFIQLTVANPKTLRSQLEVTINFAKPGDASYVSGFSRYATQNVTAVTWSLAPSLFSGADAAGAIDDMSLFSNQPCLGL